MPVRQQAVRCMRRNAPRPRTALLLLVAGAAACSAGWRRPPPLRPGPLPPRQQVQVFHGDEVERWHAVVLTEDSVSGVWFRRRTDCDSCRVALRRAAVDSLRIGDPVAGFWKTAGMVWAILTVPALILVLLGCCPYT
jgi:hypothetical protein